MSLLRPKILPFVSEFIFVMKFSNLTFGYETFGKASRSIILLSFTTLKPSFVAVPPGSERERRRSLRKKLTLQSLIAPRPIESEMTSSRNLVHINLRALSIN
jgi:hypothetical protein